MPPVTPADVPALIPDAPQPEQVHVTLASIWVAGELARLRIDPAGLTAEQQVLVRTAIAAKSLALKAGLSGTISLTGTAASGGLKGIKLPGLELTLTPTSTSVHGSAVVAAADWEAFALQVLALLGPARRVGAFAGVSR